MVNGTHIVIKRSVETIRAGGQVIHGLRDRSEVLALLPRDAWHLNTQSTPYWTYNLGGYVVKKRPPARRWQV